MHICFPTFVYFFLLFFLFFLFFVQSNEDPWSLKTNLKLIPQLHLKYFGCSRRRWNQSNTRGQLGSMRSQVRWPECDIPIKDRLWRVNSSKVYSLTMISMARGGWSMQLGLTDRLDPLFMLAGLFSTAGAASFWCGEESTLVCRIEPTQTFSASIHLS